MAKVYRRFMQALLALLLLSGSAFAQTPTYVYYVPFPEQQIHNAFTVLYSGTGTSYQTVISVVPSESNLIIHYDHWEDGYEPTFGVKTQTSTQIWGDNNPANGMAPGYATDIIVAGKPIVLKNTVTLPRNPSSVLFDGRDKFGSSKSLTASRSSWASTPGTVLADAIEFYNSRTFGNNFIFPIGQNTPSDNSFGLVSLCVMAMSNATTVNVDRDGNGSIDVTSVINQGESFQVNGGIQSGGTVSSDKPVQAGLITGRIGGTYASRWYSLLPYSLWDDAYFTPVGQTNANSRSEVFLFNPQTSSINITVKSLAGTSVIPVGSKATYRYTVPASSAAHFYSTSKFYAVGGTDMDPSNNLTWDWGYSLVPEFSLTNSVYVGWGPGSYVASGPITQNGNPLWVSSTDSVNNVTIYVDLDGNPATGPLTDINGDKYDASYVLLPFSIRTIYDNSDNDQTGIHVYTLDGSNIVAAWGEDAATAGPGNPFLDVGTTIPPDPSFFMKKAYTFTYDPLSNRLADAGDTIRFTINVINNTLQPYTDIYIFDTIPTQVEYVPNSTYYNLIQIPDQVSPNSPCPIDEGGFLISMLPATARDSITFKAVVKAPVNYLKFLNWSWAVDNFDARYRSNVTVPANPPTTTACDLDFKQSNYSTDASTYDEGGTIYLNVTDGDQDFNTAAIDSVKVTLTASSGDDELVYLLETGVSTGIFRRAFSSSKVIGTLDNDGILYAPAGNTITVNYTDAIYGGSCSDNAGIVGPSFRKPLYLSDSLSATGLDRVLPYDGSAATSAMIYGGGTGSATLTPVADAILNEALPAINYGAAGLISLEAAANALRPVLRFDLSAYAGYVITSASLALTRNDAQPSDVTVDVHKITSDWTEGTGTVANWANNTNTIPPTGTSSNVSWSNRTGTTAWTSSGGDYNVTASATQSNMNTAITGLGTLVQDWIDNPLSNYGMLIKGQTESGTNGATERYDFFSRENGTPSNRPQLTINYSLPTSITFTQNPTMCGPITLPAGGLVKVKLWLTNHSGMGSDGSSKNITATIRKNGVGFLTINTATWSDKTGTANDTLVFSGSLSSAVSLAAMDYVDFVINAAGESGASFQISYDASTVPSMLQLPAANVIDISSFGVYDAAYSGGSLITTAYNGNTVYVRAVVNDPFGAYDINGAALRITDPASNNSDVNMTLVNSSGCTRTYEYVWTTGLTQGTYNLRVITSEGLENEIKDTAQTSFTLSFLDTGTPCALDFTNSSWVPVTSYANANGTLYVSLTDFDENSDAGTTQTVAVTIVSSSGDQENLTLSETGNNTGIFRGSISYNVTTVGTSNNGTVYAPAGAILSVNYTDPDASTDVCTDNAFIVAGTNSISILKERLEPVDFYAVVGDTVRWKITITNTGSNTTTGLSLTDTVSATCFDFISASPAQTSHTPTAVHTLTWDATALGGNLAPGASTSVITTYKAISGCGVKANRATVNATNGPVTATDTSRVGLDNPGISIVKSRSPIVDPTYVGEPVSFTITVTNTGNTILSTVPLFDQYSDFNFQYLSAVPSPTAAGAGQIYWANIGPIAVGASVNLTVNFTALNGNQGSYVINNASVDFAFDEHGNPLPSVNDSARLYIYSPPIAIDDYDTTLVNTPVTGTVMFNDYDDDGDILTVTTPNSGTAAGIGGTFTIDAAGVYTYTPPANTTGTASFTYEICDPTAKCDTATVYITVLPCYDPPVRPDNVR
jgi:large repetitive protein